MVLFLNILVKCNLYCQSMLNLMSNKNIWSYDILLNQVSLLYCEELLYPYNIEIVSSISKITWLNNYIHMPSKIKHRDYCTHCNMELPPVFLYYTILIAPNYQWCAYRCTSHKQRIQNINNNKKAETCQKLIMYQDVF